MAIKLALTAALLVALVALATATTYTTTVTTTTVEDEEANPQQCQRQIQGRQFRSCQRYLSQRRQYNNGEEDESVLEMSTDVINPGQQQSQQLRDCCQQLRSVSQQCRCQAIRHAVRQQQQHGSSQQGQQMQQVYQKAKNLPQMCQFQQPQQCDIRVIFV